MEMKKNARYYISEIPSSVPLTSDLLFAICCLS